MALHLIIAQNLALYCLQCNSLLLALHPLRSMHLAVSLFPRRPGPFFREIRTVLCVEQRSILGLARRCFYISTGVLCDKSNTRSKLSRDFMCAVCVLVRPSSPAAVTPNTPIPGVLIEMPTFFCQTCGFVQRGRQTCHSMSVSQSSWPPSRFLQNCSILGMT
jgi:hypothetical protein